MGKMEPLEMGSGEDQHPEDEEEEEAPLVEGKTDGIFKDSPSASSATAASNTAPKLRNMRRKAAMKNIVLLNFSAVAQCCFVVVMIFFISVLFIFGTYKHGNVAQLIQQCRNELTNSETWETWKYAQGDLAKREWCRYPSRGELTNDFANEEPPCQCDNPLIPRGRQNDDAWDLALERNAQLVRESTIDEGSDRPLDMVILGDSIVEHWLGTRVGTPDPGLEKQKQVYEKLFRNPDSLIRGLALGISGDRAPNLLFRLEHGEMPHNFNPPLWWVLVGTNDLFSSNCSVNATLAGIIQVVEHILDHKPDGTIVVIHSILPRGSQSLLFSGGNNNMYWRYISELNHHLRCYSMSKKHVEFYNATSFFLTNDNSAQVNQTLMPDLLHPNELGSIKWGEALVLRTMEILRKDDIPESDVFDGVDFWQ